MTHTYARRAIFPIVFRVPRSGFQYSAVEKGRCAHFGFFIFRFPFDMCSVVKETAPKEHTSGTLSALSAFSA